MIAPLLEAKRRLAWEVRLGRSSLRCESAEGGRTALWVFDTLHGPDGYALREMMLRLAQRERLALFSFGPRVGTRSAPLRGFARALAPDWAESFAQGVARQVRGAASECGAALFVVGSANGTFAEALPREVELWEVQHGLLDPSYFPLRADRFFTRSTTSTALMQRMAPEIPLTVLSGDLSPPRTSQGDLSRARALVCYSKNPGGGCTAAELARFEHAAADLARRLGRPFQLKLHPRDGKLKLVARHRRFSITRHLEPLAADVAGPRLVISSFSTALAAETQPGDLLLNVALSPPDPVLQAEYGWLPLVEISDLAVPGNLPVVERA